MNDTKNKDKKNNKEIKKQILIESDLHAPFKSYCSSVEQKTVKAVISNMIRARLRDSGFKVISTVKQTQDGGSHYDE